jgi:large repetitive protein
MSALIRRIRPALRLEQLETRDNPVVFSNPASITIPLVGSATPYPSTINVSGMGDQVTGVTVTLTNITHTYPNDVDILLVGPQGQNVVLMSDVGGTTAVTNVTVTFSQSAGSSLTTGSLPAGTYLPTNSGTGDTFPAPAPASPHGTTLTSFVGTNPNGAWSLYVVDDAGFEKTTGLSRVSS